MNSAHTMKRLSDRNFGLALVVVFLVLAALGWLLFDAVPVWAMVVAGVFLVLALALPASLLPLNCLWHALAFRLGRVTNFLILGLFFFIFILPVGFVLRLFGWDPLCRAQDPGVESYFTPVQRRTSAETLPDMF